MATLEVFLGDITKLSVDAIVNAANSSLMGGGGVDGAIHAAGGSAILEACMEIRRNQLPNGLPTGAAVWTPGGDLPARYVIHTVGPIYGRDPEPAVLLAACYRNCLAIAQELELSSIAFPAISTGVYGYPKEEAATIAVTTIRSHLNQTPSSLLRVILVAFSAEDAARLRTLCDH